MHRRFRISRSSVAAAIAEIGGVGDIGLSRFRAAFVGLDVYLSSRGVVSTNLLRRCGGLRTHVGVVVDVDVPTRWNDNTRIDRDVDRYATPTHVVVDTTPQYEARADEEIGDDTRQRRRRGRQDWEEQARQLTTPVTAAAMSVSMRHDDTVQTGQLVYAVDNETVSASPDGPPIGCVVSVNGNSCVVAIDPPAHRRARYLALWPTRSPLQRSRRHRRSQVAHMVRCGGVGDRSPWHSPSTGSHT